VAIRAAYPCESFFKITALKKLINGRSDYRSPKTILCLIPFGIDFLKLIEIISHYLEKLSLMVAWTIKLAGRLFNAVIRIWPGRVYCAQSFVFANRVGTGHDVLQVCGRNRRNKSSIVPELKRYRNSRGNDMAGKNLEKSNKSTITSIVQTWCAVRRGRRFIIFTTQHIASLCGGSGEQKTF
jgi:hypothetical protein